MSGADVGASTVTVWVTLELNKTVLGISELDVPLTSELADVRSSVKSLFSNHLSRFDPTDIALFLSSKEGVKESPPVRIGDVLEPDEALQCQVVRLNSAWTVADPLYLLAEVESGACWGCGVVIWGRLAGALTPHPLFLGVPPVAGAGAGLLADIRTIVREEVRAPLQDIAISEATAWSMGKLLEGTGVYATQSQPPPAVEPGFLPEFKPFDWSSGETACTADACVRLSQYLASAGVAMTTPVTPGFKVADVHTFNDQLTSQLGRVRLNGTTDAIIIPSTQMVEFAVQQARIVVDFKTDASEFGAVIGQAQAELLAATSLSRHDVMVVFTDLNARGHIFRAEAKTLLVWKDLDIPQTILVMAQFLTTSCASVGVVDLDDERVPGSPESKRRRKVFVDAVHAMCPTNQTLLDQLEAYQGGGLGDFLEGRDLVLSSFGY